MTHEIYLACNQGLEPEYLTAFLSQTFAVKAGDIRTFDNCYDLVCGVVKNEEDQQGQPKIIVLHERLRFSKFEPLVDQTNPLFPEFKQVHENSIEKWDRYTSPYIQLSTHPILIRLEERFQSVSAVDNYLITARHDIDLPKIDFGVIEENEDGPIILQGPPQT